MESLGPWHKAGVQKKKGGVQHLSQCRTPPHKLSLQWSDRIKIFVLSATDVPPEGDIPNSFFFCSQLKESVRDSKSWFWPLCALRLPILSQILRHLIVSITINTDYLVAANVLGRFGKFRMTEIAHVV